MSLVVTGSLSRDAEGPKTSLLTHPVFVSVGVPVLRAHFFYRNDNTSDPEPPVNSGVVVGREVLPMSSGNPQG